MFYVQYEGRDGLRTIYPPCSALPREFPTQEAAETFLRSLPGYARHPEHYYVSTKRGGIISPLGEEYEEQE